MTCFTSVFLFERLVAGAWLSAWAVLFLVLCCCCSSGWGFSVIEVWVYHFIFIRFQVIYHMEFGDQLQSCFWTGCLLLCNIPMYLWYKRRFVGTLTAIFLDEAFGILHVFSGMCCSIYSLGWNILGVNFGENFSFRYQVKIHTSNSLVYFWFNVYFKRVFYRENSDYKSFKVRNFSSILLVYMLSFFALSFCRKFVLNGNYLSFLFWVLFTHSPSSNSDIFCNFRKRNHWLDRRFYFFLSCSSFEH
ncbi:uncharacterized protein LOC110107576 isoform X2 [Dendrobium catenatum]|uniref:uncharacterized protein LOC110107576 isoform X2 n=1 Tax=Dendrobium catenatum TaxID=906689 RepID=UPI0009F5DAF9|nr:uncharacterized protein LOC110107576 isoform X2 [Dendrobium catenatum]